MKSTISFDEIVEAADSLSIDEQETLIDILNHRFYELRKAEILSDVRTAQEEFDDNKCEPATPDELMKEILS